MLGQIQCRPCFEKPVSLQLQNTRAVEVKVPPLTHQLRKIDLLLLKVAPVQLYCIVVTLSGQGISLVSVAAWVNIVIESK